MITPKPNKKICSNQITNLKNMAAEHTKNSIFFFCLGCGLLLSLSNLHQSHREMPEPNL